MGEAHDWVPLVTLGLAIAGALAGLVRYVDVQLSDKVSIGEYNRRHDDIEKRLRDVEYKQARTNGAVIREAWRGLHDPEKK